MECQFLSTTLVGKFFTLPWLITRRVAAPRRCSYGFSLPQTWERLLSPPKHLLQRDKYVKNISALTIHGCLSVSLQQICATLGNIENRNRNMVYYLELLPSLNFCDLRVLISDVRMCCILRFGSHHVICGNFSFSRSSVERQITIFKRKICSFYIFF